MLKVVTLSVVAPEKGGEEKNFDWQISLQMYSIFADFGQSKINLFDDQKPFSFIQGVGTTTLFKAVFNFAA